MAVVFIGQIELAYF